MHKSTIYLNLTNKSLFFQSSSAVEAGLTDHHKFKAKFVKSHFARLDPKTVLLEKLLKL